MVYAAAGRMHKIKRALVFSFAQGDQHGAGFETRFFLDELRHVFDSRLLEETDQIDVFV